MLTISVICPFCHAESFITVRYEDYLRWNDGELVQNAFPYLSAEEREALITGLCIDCQGRLFCEPEL